jgi:cysteine desulfurase/selenocysteine lyase
MNLSRFRDFFPVTQSSVYLNHAAISPLSVKVTNAIKEHLEKRSKGQIEVIEDVVAAKERLKKNIGQLIGCQKEEIAIVTNTSEGLNWLANGFTWNKGDRILLFRDEFPANIYPFMNLMRHGVEIDFVPSENGFTDIALIDKKITQQTKVLSVSFVKFYNGYRNDLHKISELCHQNDILFSVDGIQGIGALPLDVGKMHIDFISNGGHKWLMGPLGCGFMYVSPRIRKILSPVFAGWLSVKDSWNFFDYNLDFLEDASRFEIGTSNAIGIIGAAAATDLLCEITPQVIEGYLSSLGDYLIRKMNSVGLEFTGSENKKHWSGIFAFRGSAAKNLFEYLKENRIYCSLREGAVRFSPHFYNSEADIDFLYDKCEKYYESHWEGA